MGKVIAFPKTKTPAHNLPADVTVVMIETPTTGTTLLDLDVLYNVINNDMPLKDVPVEMMVVALVVCYETIVGQLSMQGLIEK